MQDRTDVHDIRIGIATFGNGFFKPAVKFPSLLRCVDIFVIFNVIQYQQVRPPVPVPPSSDLLPGSQCFHFDVRIRQQGFCIPGFFPFQISEILDDVIIFFQFVPDIFQEAFCLIGAVRYDDQIMFIPV